MTIADMKRRNFIEHKKTSEFSFIITCIFDLFEKNFVIRTEKEYIQ